MHLVEAKKSNLSIFVSRVMKRIGYSDRKNCIGQAVPDDWYDISIEATKEIRNDFLSENVDVVVNADQTFINFHPESSYVIVPKSSRHVGGNVKADVKLGFTLMVTAELNSSTLQDPFVVFTGIKMEEAASETSRLQTNDYKYSTWREDGNGTSYVNFQRKHWFDTAITIQYLKVLLHKMYPGKKVGLIWDYALQHYSVEVMEYINEMKAAGRIVVKYIPKGVTSVMQVCDFIANKMIKQLIKQEYVKWRAEKIAKQ